MHALERRKPGPARARRERREPFRPHQMPIVVRMKYGDALYGMKVVDDGVIFHSPHPMPEGRVVELILCNGAVVVDAEILACRPMLADLAGFAVRARYLQPSAELRTLINQEIDRHMPADDLPTVDEHPIPSDFAEK